MALNRLENLSRQTLLLLILGAFVLSIVATVLIELAYADKFAMQVNVIKSANKIGINPLTDSLDFGDIYPGGKVKRYITVKNDGPRSTLMVVWVTGTAGEMVTANDSYLTLEPGKKRRLTFLIKVPASASFQTYQGRVWLIRLPKLI